MGKWTEMKEMRERGSRSYGEKSKAKKMLAELKEMMRMYIHLPKKSVMKSTLTTRKDVDGR